MKQYDMLDMETEVFEDYVDPWSYNTDNYIIHYPAIFSQGLMDNILSYEVYIPDLPFRITFPSRTLEEAKREAKDILVSWLKAFPLEVAPPSSMEKIKKIADQKYTVYTIEYIYIDVEEELA